MVSFMAVCVCILAALMLEAIGPAESHCSTTLLQALAANPALSQLTQVIQESGLSDKINKTENVTVLAPNNVAFQGLNALLAQNNLTLANITEENNNRAASILLYHIITSPVIVSQLKNGQRWPTSLRGYNLTVSKWNETSISATVAFAGNVNNATVVAANMLDCYSVVHVVDRVLLPNATLSAIPTYNRNTPTPGVGGSGTPDLAIGTWSFALSGALALALMI